MREETSAHILCECEALASLRHMYLGSFFLEPEDIRSLGLGAIWNFSKATESHDSIWDTKGLLKGLGASGLRGPEPKYQSINLSIYPSITSNDVQSNTTSLSEVCHPRCVFKL